MRSRGSFKAVGNALILEVGQAMFQHAFHGCLHGVVAAAHLEAQRGEFFHRDRRMIMTILALVSTNVSENLRAGDDLGHFGGLLYIADQNHHSEDVHAALFAEVDSLLQALAAFLHLLGVGGIGIAAGNQQAIGALQSLKRCANLGHVLITGQNLGGFLHISGVLQLHSSGTGSGQTLGCTVNGQRAAEAILNISNQGNGAGGGNTADDLFQVGQVGETIVNHAVAGDGNLTTGEQAHRETAHLNGMVRSAVINAGNQEAFIGCIQDLPQCFFAGHKFFPSFVSLGCGRDRWLIFLDCGSASRNRLHL